MQKFLLFSLFLWLHFSSTSSTESYEGKEGEQTPNNGPVRLFVFGDSYADTGNWNKSIASAWKVPYGMTYPGKPAGRFSDGRILTDYIASYLQIKPPIPYEEWNLFSGSKKAKKVGFGMNFAYGGTGVFNTDISRPNMTTQIDIFEHLINQSQVYLNHSSIALVSVGGNDYSNFLKHPTNLTIPEFTKSMINQLVVNLERIHSFGVQKIVITLLEPIGCLPAVTLSYSEYKNCTQAMNEVAAYHNMVLQEKIDLLNKKTKDGTFITLDLYSAFMSYLQPGNSENVDRLEPCCKGVTTNYECGSIEANVTKYTLCEKPDTAFFWDKVHPTQNGWYQVYMTIKPTLAKILKQ